MYAISSGISRVLIATSTAPARGTPKCASRSSWTLGARNATRSPCAIPLSWSATASRLARSRVSAHVRRRSPSTTAVRSGNASAARSRNATGVSGECETSTSASYTARVSPGAAAELRLDVLEPDPSRGEEHVGMEEDVRDLLDQPLVGLAGSGQSRLEPLLAHLARGQRRVVEQRDDVRARRPLLLALLDPAPQPRREARLGARVAGRARGAHAEEDRVAVAVVAHLLDRHRVPRRRALVPVLLPRAAPEPRLAALARAPQRLVVHPGEHQHAVGLRVLDDRRQSVRTFHPASFSSRFSSGSRSGRSCTIEAISAASAPAANASARWRALAGAAGGDHRHARRRPRPSGSARGRSPRVSRRRRSR